MFPPQSRTTRDLEAPHYSDELPPYVEDVEEVAKEKEAVTDEPRPSLQVDEHPARRDSTQTDEPRTSLSSADGLCLDSADDIRLDSFDESRKLTNPYESVGGGRFSKFSGVAKKALGYLAILLPTFLRRTSDSPKKLHSSAWLDGLRGVAAFCVVFHHASLVVFGWDIHGGWVPGSGQPWLVQFIKLPIIRLLIGGPQQVAIFFVVSGYAISYKPLRQARAGQFRDVGITLFSSVFRRHTRLFMPAAFITLCCALSVQIDRDWYGSDGLPGVAVPTRVPPIENDLMSQLKNWALGQVLFTNPLNNGLAQATDPHIAGNAYDANLWTLPVEFSSSLVVFVFLMAFAMVYNRIRMAAAVAVIFYLEWYFIFWTVFLFMSGMLICDLHFELDEISARRAERRAKQAAATSTSMPTGPDDAQFVLPIWARVGSQKSASFFSKVTDKLAHLRGAKRLAGRLIGIMAFLLSLHVLGVPAIVGGARYSFGYVTLMSWVPERLGDSLVTPLGAIATVFVLDRAPFLQVLFTNRFSQFLGRISFSLYMIHGPLLWSIGLKFMHYFLGITGGATDATYGMAVFLSAFFWWIIAIYLADLTTTFVDKPSVRFSRWAYSKISKEDSG